jgi:hypothetical protein
MRYTLLPTRDAITDTRPTDPGDYRVFSRGVAAGYSSGKWLLSGTATMRWDKGDYEIEAAAVVTSGHYLSDGGICDGDVVEIRQFWAEGIEDFGPDEVAEAVESFVRQQGGTPDASLRTSVLQAMRMRIAAMAAA